MPGDGDPDLELLLAETQVLWGTDLLGRYIEPPLGAVAISAAGQRLLIRPDLDDDLTGSLRHVLGSWALAVPADELRPALTSALPLLAAAGISAEVQGGPSYLIETPPAGPASATVADSNAPDEVYRAGAHRPVGWPQVQWDALLAGRLGPWAMVLGQSEVLSTCHTARDGAAGVEATIWADPRLSGAGDVVAATSRWADLMRKRDDRPLFYNPADSSEAAQQIAAVPGLYQLGWIWSVRLVRGG